MVMLATRGIGRESKKFYSRSAEMISSKRVTSYNITVAWIRRKITFSLIKSIGICRRGSHSIFCSDSLEQSLNCDAVIKL